MLTFESARDPVYASADGQAIFVMAKFAEFEEELPFNATSYDPMPYGQEIHRRAAAGEFGPVAAYVPLPEQPGAPQPAVTGAQTL